MDKELLHIVNEEAKTLNIGVDPSFKHSLDDYFTKTKELKLTDAQKKIVATYLSVKAINIAKVDNKSVLDLSDLKAALWHFHEPKDLRDTECKKAATFILKEHEGGDMPDSLPDEFRKYLESETNV